MQGRGDDVGGRDAHRGRAIVTLEDVARVAGVHYSTVSRALDPATLRRVGLDTRKHVHAGPEKMGDPPGMVASGFKRGRTPNPPGTAPRPGDPNTLPAPPGLPH